MTAVPSERAFIAKARTDAQDRLIEADEPLAGLHVSCGGEAMGTLAIPELLAMVRKARKYGVPLARSIVANDGDEQVSAWVEAVPLGIKGEDGCEIGVESWHTAPLAQAGEREEAERRITINRAAAEFAARLDPRQNVLSAASSAADLQQLEQAMAHGAGQPWTDFVSLPGSDHRQPLHWRLLDGAMCRVDGSDREWRAVLAPMGQPEPGREGFELLLVSDTPPSTGNPGARPAEQVQPSAADGPSLGRDLAPVLRQPVARIIANAETIRTRLAGPLADEYSDYAADIASAGQHLLGLIEDLADLEVVESDRFTTAPDRIDLNEVARQAAGILGVRARERSIELALPEQGAAEVPAIGEFRRVLQILLNLLGNAVNYSPEGSRIEIAAFADAGSANISVADQGPGLDHAQRDAVFAKFERLGRSGDGGSGLGLYISQRLAEAMQGALSVESEPGEGARFTLTLPQPETSAK
ncbi:MAG: HAMP domain-containing sensor histidine kinase [Alteripontixanthobacter sp.]